MSVAIAACWVLLGGCGERRDLSGPGLRGALDVRMLEPPGQAPGEPHSFDRCPDGACPRDEPGYLFSGEFHESVVDLRVQSCTIGLDLVWARRYRSRLGPAVGRSALGNNWDHSYNIHAELRAGPDQPIIIYDGNARPAEFRSDGRGVWTAPRYHRTGEFDADGRFVLTFADGGRWIFHAEQDSAPGDIRKLWRIVDRNQNIIELEYDKNDRLERVVNASGQSLDLAYDETGHIAEVTAQLGADTSRTVRYERYGADDTDGNLHDLRSVTLPPIIGTVTNNDFPDGTRTVYTYATNVGHPELDGNLLTIEDSLGQIYLRNTYASTLDPSDYVFDRLVTQSWGDPDDRISMTYARVTPASDNNFAVAMAWVNDRVGRVSAHFFDAHNQLVLRREYTGFANPDLPTTALLNPPVDKLRPDDPEFFETRFAYNADGHVSRVIHPRGNATVSIYEGDLNSAASPRIRGNLRERRVEGDVCDSGLPPIRELFEYAPGLGNEHGARDFVVLATDARGNVTQARYDAAGNRTSIIHPEPDTREDMQYSAVGQLTRHQMPADQQGVRREIAFTYADDGHLRREIVDPDGLALTTTKEFDAACNEVRRVDPRGNDKLYIYNSRDELVRELGPATTCPATCGGGAPTRAYTDHIYDANMNLVRVDYEALDCAGAPQGDGVVSTSFSYDILNELTVTTEQIGDGRVLTSALSHDANREVTQQQLGEAMTTTSYDERGLTYRETHGAGSPDEVTTQFNYDANGNERRVLDGVEGSEQVTTSIYDCADRLTLVEDAMGNQTAFEYDAAGNQTEQSFHGELVDLPGAAANVLLSRTRVSYDAMNRPVVTTRDHFDPASQTPIGDGASVTTRVYDRESRVVLEIDDNGEQTARDFDGAGRATRTTDAEGNIVELSHDDNGNVTERALTDVSSSPADTVVGVWRYVYDEGNNLVQTTDPLGNTSHNCYDSLGRLVAEIDPRGNRTLHKHDGVGRLVESVHVMTDDGTGAGDVADLVVTRQAWDDGDRLAGREDPGGNVTLYEYDSLGRVTREQFADGGANTFAYDPHDNLVSQQDPNGTQLVFSLDQLGRRIGVTVIPGSGVNADTSFERFAYDGRSLLVHASDNDSQVSWDYDSLGAALLETQTSAGGPARALGYTRDGLGNATSTTYPGGRVVERSFDGLRRTRTIDEGGASLVQLDYVGPSLLRRTYFEPNTVSSYTYDPARRMVASEHLEIGGEVIDSRTYSFDQADNKQSEHNLGTGQVGGVRSMTHDSLGRMVGSEVAGSAATDRTVGYQLDGAGNRTSVTGGTCAGTYSLDATLNQYTQTPCEDWVHDSAGNLVETSATANPGADRELEYDHRGRLVSVVTDVATVHFGYDALGRKTRTTWQQDGASFTLHYVYDDWNVIEEYANDDSTPSATYLYGDGLDDRLQMIRGDSWWYYDDESGSTTALAHKPAVGSLWIERYAYQDFGEPSFFWAGAPATDSYSGNPYLFAGRRWLAELGLYDLRTRHLDPIAGRFISRDILGIWADDENLGNGYTYVTNAPGSGTDPTGEAKKPKIKNCHAGARANIEAWLDEAERQGRLSRDWFDGQADRKRKYRKSDWNNYKNDGREWWGKYDNTRFHRIKWNFRKIVRRCSKNVITFKCRSTGEICGFTNSAAWTHSSWHAWIRVCKNNKQGLFRRSGMPAFDADQSGAVILHEVSHNINAIGDKRLNGVKMRGDDQVRRLAASKPTRASWNAYNYQWYGLPQ